MPSQYPQNVVTKKGLAMIAESVATKKNLIFTRVVVGDGNAIGKSFNDMEAVISPKMELPVTTGVNEGNGQYLITATLSNNKLDVGFFPREVGLYAKVDGKQEMLYSYTNGGNNVGYVPDKTTPIDSEIYKIRTVIGNAKNVTFKFVDSTFVTKGELDLHNSDINAHDNRFRNYLPLTGGTLIGNVSANNSSIGFNNGNNSIDTKIRVGPNGNFDIGVTEDTLNKNATEQLMLHSQNRPKWYNSADGSKLIAIQEDITNETKKYLPLAGGTVTGAINFIYGSLKGQISLKPNGNLDLGSLDTKCSVLNSRERPLWYTGDNRGGMLALTRDIVPDPTQCVNLYDAKSEGFQTGRNRDSFDLKEPYTNYDFIIIVLSADSGQHMGVSQINVSWLEKTRKMSVGTGLEIINIATVGDFFWGISNKSTPTKMITNNGYENSHIWEIWGYKITR